MSRGARWVLGVFALIFAGIFLYTLSDSKAQWLSWGLVAFCLAIAVACFSAKGRGLALRFIGVSVFLGYLSYFLWEILANFRKLYTGISEDHWINALLGMFIYGLPGIYVTIKGIYPRWGLRSDVFAPNKNSTELTDEDASHSDHNNSS